MTLVDIGLGLDIVGAILLFKCGLPNEVSINKSWGLPAYEAEATLRASGQLNSKWLLYKRLSRVGISCLAVGFALQLLGNHLTK